MLKVTKAAAKQIRRQAAQGDMEELALRIVPSRAGDGSIEYTIGFDEVGADDTLISASGVDIVFRSSDKEMLSGMTLDYAEVEPDVCRLIFLNPNDPHFRAPME